MKYVTFESHEVNIHLVAKLSGPAQVISHHSEGWQQIQRMWKYSFTEWQGGPGYEVDIPVMFDQYTINAGHGVAMNSVEASIAKLETLIEKIPDKPRTPIFTFDAKGAVPHDKTRDPTRLWVMGGTTTWEQDSTIINPSNDRTRQMVLIQAWEWIPDQVTQANNLLPTRSVPKTYKIKQGDTLVKIAVYFYGDGSKWRQIAQLNNLKDPNHPKVGKIIKLPAP